MNYQPSKRRSRLTSKCQVTIPKEIRDALGLKACDLVDFSLDEDGRATIAPASDQEKIEARKARIMKGIMEARRLFKEQNCFPEGMTNEQWYELMRGPPAEV